MGDRNGPLATKIDTKTGSYLNLIAAKVCIDLEDQDHFKAGNDAG
jgi:hypothetical protein